MDKIDKLYQNYDILADSKNKPSEHEAEYLEIIESVKGKTNEKMLACQFIPRFLKEFPDLASAALDAQLDLVEDEDVSIRKHAVKHLPAFCKESKACVAKISDILAQMLQTEDSAELATVQNTLMTIMKVDPKATLDGIFGQIGSTDEDVIRKRAIQFLCTKFKFIPPDIATKDVEDFVLEKCKKVFPELGGEDFLNLMPLLANLKIAKSVPVQQALVNLIADQAEMDGEIQVSLDYIAGFLQCVRLALPYFSPFVHSTQFVSYICLSVIPKLGEIELLDNGAELSLDIIKLLTEISTFVHEDKQLSECIDAVYKIVIEYVPLPPPADAENGTQPDEPNLQFTHIECWLYIFLHLLKHVPDFLAGADNVQRSRDLKTRLQFLARSVQSGVKTFREALVTVKGKEAKPEETKLKAIALRTMNNINSLIKDLFRTPPSFKTVMTLSWKPVSSTSTRTSIVSPSVKRPSEGESTDDRKQIKRDGKAGRELYHPPSGKYSTNLNSFSRAQRGGSNYYRGRGRRFY